MLDVTTCATNSLETRIPCHDDRELGQVVVVITVEVDIKRREEYEFVYRHCCGCDQIPVNYTSLPIRMGGEGISRTSHSC